MDWSNTAFSLRYKCCCSSTSTLSPGPHQARTAAVFPIVPEGNSTPAFFPVSSAAMSSRRLTVSSSPLSRAWVLPSSPSLASRMVSSIPRSGMVRVSLLKSIILLFTLLLQIYLSFLHFYPSKSTPAALPPLPSPPSRYHRPAGHPVPSPAWSGWPGPASRSRLSPCGRRLQ